MSYVPRNETVDMQIAEISNLVYGRSVYVTVA